MLEFRIRMFCVLAFLLIPLILTAYAEPSDSSVNLSGGFIDCIEGFKSNGTHCISICEDGLSYKDGMCQTTIEFETHDNYAGEYVGMIILISLLVVTSIIFVICYKKFKK